MARRCLLRRHGGGISLVGIGAMTIFPSTLWFNLILVRTSFSFKTLLQ
jgi:hypothetical protein